MTQISAADARWLALNGQGLLGSRRALQGLTGMLRRVGAVQLDTISVLARSQELVAYARLGVIGRKAIEKAYWGHPHRAFEYWGHAASILPMEEWPYFAFRRRASRRRHQESQGWMTQRSWTPGSLSAMQKDVVARVRAEGALTVSELGGARSAPGWWEWSQAKVAVERAFAEGELACVERRAWKRIYDLPERVIPAELLNADPGDEECFKRLVEISVRAMGVATLADIADYFRLSRAEATTGLAAARLVAVEVEGWAQPAWADESNLEKLGGKGRMASRTTLLSPFDSLIWSRKRTARLFGYTHVFEPYVPAAKRVQGYFTMPLLTGGRLRGWVDPAREGSTLVARNLSVDAGAIRAMARALREAAAWVGCSEVRLERVEPEEIRLRLAALLDA